MPTSPSACQETSHWPRAEERKAEERMVLQNYAFTVSSLLPRLLLHWPTKKCSPLSQSTKYTDSSTVETTPRAPGRGQNQSRSALNSASHSGERRRGVALTHAEVVRRDGCWQSDGLADLDGAGARGGLQLPALHRGAPCARHFNVRGSRRTSKVEAAEGSKAAEEGVPTAATSSSSCSVSTSPVLPRIQGA